MTTFAYVYQPFVFIFVKWIGNVVFADYFIDEFGLTYLDSYLLPYFGPMIPHDFAVSLRKSF